MAGDRHSKKGESAASPSTQADSRLAQPQMTSGQDPLAVFDEHRGLLFSIAYRMLGTRADAEDMVQETFLRWQKAPNTEIRDPRAFLVTVITRLCINQLQSARVQREQYFGQWLPEPLPTGVGPQAIPMPAIDGSLSMAFLMLLERLTPMERAVFLLHEVFEYRYADIAEALGQSEANCRQLLRRAKQHIAKDRPRFVASREQQEKLLQQFLETSARGDMQGLLDLLSEDVVLYADGGGKVTAVPNPIYGAERVARFFFGAREKLLPKEVVRCLAEMNGQPGVVAYHHGRAIGVLTIDVAEGRIRNIYIVRNPDKLRKIQNLPPAPC
jgi:RNA polymerase sigma-70 factor, ECF subfamily